MNRRGATAARPFDTNLFSTRDVTVFDNLISIAKFLFSKDKGLCVFIHGITGFFPRNVELYRLALVHRSLPVKDASNGWANNERLEFLGDAILDAVVGTYLYNLYPDKPEGFLTSTRAKIVQRESLNRIGKLLRIDTRVRAAAHSSSHNSYIAGNAVEALVGAIYLDRGFKACRRFIEKRLIAAHIDLNDLVRTEQNYKSRLIEWTQKYRVNIEFELIDTFSDAQGSPIFKTAILLGGIFAADAIGYSKKESHQGASKKAYERLHDDKLFAQRVLATAAMN
ncbi:MAG: ribonuclease III [Muribaculaceae bacterium]|nr:ribonuclease III [Muribaculaceae bacterium]